MTPEETAQALARAKRIIKYDYSPNADATIVAKALMALTEEQQPEPTAPSYAQACVESARQREKGWTVEHDRQHTHSELVAAALTYHDHFYKDGPT